MSSELWETLASESIFTDRPRYTPKKKEPEFGTTSTPGYVLDQSGQYVPSLLEVLSRESEEAAAGVEEGIRTSARSFLEDSRQPGSEVIPMNPLQWGVQSAGRTLREAPMPLGIGEPLGEFVESAAVGRSTAEGAAMAGLDAINFAPGLGWGAYSVAPAVKGAVTQGAKNVARQLPKGSRYTGEHMGVRRLDDLDPGAAALNPNPYQHGAERLREGHSDAFYAYDAGVPTRQESNLGHYGSRFEAKRVLDLGTKEAKKLRNKARINVTRQAKKAAAGRWAANPDPQAITNEFEFLVQEAGYNGIAREAKNGRTIQYFNTAPVTQHTERVVPVPTQENIARHVAQNPEGGSIYPNTGTAPTEGIAVADRGGEVVIPGPPTAGQLSSYLDTGSPDDLVGWWQNDGKTYLDRSRVYESPLSARFAGEMNYQKAGYDIGAGEEIPMTVRPLVEGYQAYRDANRVDAGGQLFGQRGAVGDLKMRQAGDDAVGGSVEPELFMPPEPLMQMHPTKIEQPEIVLSGKSLDNFNAAAIGNRVLRTAANYMTPDELLKVSSTRANLPKVTQILNLLPKANEMIAVAKAGAPKRGWYRYSSNAIVDTFGLDDAPRFAGLLAATSPQTSVESNLKNALNIWKNWTAAGRPTDRHSIIKIMGASVEGDKGTESVLNAWVNNSVSALSAKDAKGIVLSGPKVDSFQRNLFDDVMQVTNDAWAAKWQFGHGRPLVKEEIMKEGGDPQSLFGAKKSALSPSGKGNAYIASNARQRQAAEMIGFNPEELQETTWSWVKPAYELAYGGPGRRTALRALSKTNPKLAIELNSLPKGGVRELIARGALTPEVIAATPDFGTLFSQPEYADIIRAAGLEPKYIPHKMAPTMELTAADKKQLMKTATRLDQLGKSRGSVDVGLLPFMGGLGLLGVELFDNE